MAEMVKPATAAGIEVAGYHPLPEQVARPALFDKTAWRDAAVAWLGQRVALLALTYLMLWRLMPAQKGAGNFPPSGAYLLHIWTNWDGAIYATIAQSGYTLLTQAAFFPLYPLLERLLSPLFGADPALAGLILANVACLVAFGLLRILAERECGREAARRALLYLALFPYSLFLAAAYTESLFLALSLATFLALRSRHWRQAGLLAMLATLTRPVGILLLIPLIYEFFHTSGRVAGSDVSQSGRVEAGIFQWRTAEIIALTLPLAALAGFNLALAPTFGTLLPATAAQAAGWGRTLRWPWDGLLWAGSAVLHGEPGLQVHAVLDIFWTLVFAALALATVWPYGPLRLRLAADNRARLPLAYGLYALGSAALVLLTPMHKPGFFGAALASNGRFMLVVFPLFLLLGAAGLNQPALHRVVVGIFITCSLILTVAFIGGAFVA